MVAVVVEVEMVVEVVALVDAEDALADAAWAWVVAVAALVEAEEELEFAVSRAASAETFAASDAA